MEWLTQNWIWIAILIGVVAFLGFSRRSHGGHLTHDNGDGSAGRVRLGGCCGGGNGKSVLATVEGARVAAASRRERGEHGKQPPSDKPGAAHGHQH